MITLTELIQSDEILTRYQVMDLLNNITTSDLYTMLSDLQRVSTMIDVAVTLDKVDTTLENIAPDIVSYINDACLVVQSIMAGAAQLHEVTHATEQLYIASAMLFVRAQIMLIKNITTV